MYIFVMYITFHNTINIFISFFIFLKSILMINNNSLEIDFALTDLCKKFIAYYTIFEYFDIKIMLIKLKNDFI